MTRTSSRLPLLILALALALVFYRLLLGDVLFWGLPSLQFYPWREYAFDLLRHGQLPLWNPYDGAGTPLFANYQSSLLYPFSWIGYFLPLAQSLSIIAVLHLFIGGWGMWRFTGELEFSSLGRGVSALAFGMTSYLVARLGTFPEIQTVAWLPWILWASTRLLDNGRPRYAGLLALFTALLLLGGHAQTAWYSLLLTGLFVLWRTLTRRPSRWPRLGFVVIGLVVGAGMASLQLLATAELLRQSQRSGGVDFAYAMNYSYAPARIFNLIAPNVFGTPANGSYITQGAFFEDAVYIGLIPLIAAVAAIVQWIRSRRQPDRPTIFHDVPFWLMIVIVAMAFALGDNTPIFPFLYNHVPTFNLFQGPERWHLWTVFGLSILGGVGVTTWSRNRNLRRWTARLTVACFALALLGVLGVLFVHDAKPGVSVLLDAVLSVGLLGVAAGVLTLTQPQPDTRAFGRWSAVVLIVVAIDLIVASWGLNPTVPASFYNANPPPSDSARRYWTASAEQRVKFEQWFTFNNYLTATEHWQDARASGLADLNIIDRVPLLNNFEPLLIGHYTDFLNLVEAGSTASLFQAADVDAIYNPTLTPLTSGLSIQRTWLVSSVCWHTDEDSLKKAMSDPSWRPDQQVQMLGDRGCADPDAASAGSANLVTDDGDQVTIHVNAVRDSWLVLADTNYPGWHATVDGAEVPIYQANLNFRAVQVQAGQHVVQFDYRPGWLLPGALISAVSLLVALLLYRLGA